MSRARWLALLALLATPVMAGRFDWAQFEQYRSESRLLHFDAGAGQTAGTLLIWPELDQPHWWLAMAEYWQQRGWDFLLLLPDPGQQAFDPVSEQPSQAQQDWLEQQALRLNEALAGTESEPPLVVMVQGSAALWFQQLIDAGRSRAPDALALLDAHPRVAEQQRMLAISLARSSYPVLDIHGRADDAATSANRQRRRQQAARQEKTDYETQRLSAHALLERQLAGWLMRRGWLPLPPSAPDYLKGQTHEAGISRSQDPGAGH
ncbi:DUF3530 family protein [Zobellella sp. An-6]|uniref:DUF3530 family protein n=1 Tax=Zobellella sp. An-6 TaxID=3400218 RepID=UPI004041BBAF